MHLFGTIFAIFLATSFFQVQGSPAGGGHQYELLRGVKKSLCCCSSSDVGGHNIVLGKLSKKVSFVNGFSFHQDRSVTGFGPDKKYTLSTLIDACHFNTIESLTTALGLDTLKKGTKKIDFKKVLTQFINSQSRSPQNHHSINFETAMIFAERFTEIAPETAATLKTISYLIMSAKQLQGKSVPVDTYNLIQPALNDFFGSENIDSESVQTWKDLTPLICEAAQGNVKTAKQIASVVDSRIFGLKGLTAPGSQLKMLHLFIEQTVQYPKVLSRA